MSSGTLIVRRLENQIILKYLEACKWKDLYRTASIIQGYLWSVQDSKHHARLPMICTGQQASFKATYDLYRTASIIQGYLCSVQDSKHHSRLPMFCTGQQASFKANYVWGSLILVLRRVWRLQVIWICISKNRQHNGQKKKYERTDNDLQNIHIKLKIE